MKISSLMNVTCSQLWGTLDNRPSILHACSTPTGSKWWHLGGGGGWTFVLPCKFRIYYLLGDIK